MTFVGLLLKYIFIVAVLIAVFVIGVVVYFMHRVRHLAQQFAQTGGARNAGNGRGAGAEQPHTANGDGSMGYGSKANGEARNESRAGASGETYEEVDEELYDTRNPDVANRKIFAKDEGEYVDFDEE